MDGTGTFKISQEAAGAGSRLSVVDADKNPSRGPINRNEQIAPGALTRYLWQVFTSMRM